MIKLILLLLLLGCNPVLNNSLKKCKVRCVDEYGRIKLSKEFGYGKERDCKNELAKMKDAVQFECNCKCTYSWE